MDQLTFQKQNKLDSIVISKYQCGSQIFNETMNLCIGLVKSGTKIYDIINYCTQFMKKCLDEKTSLVNAKEFGIALPLCLNVNGIIRYYSPNEQEQMTLKNHDIVKIEFGVHIDGYISKGVHTVVVNDTPSVYVTGRRADAVVASYFASEAVIRMLKPQNNSSDITKMIERISKYYCCEALNEGITYEMKRFVLEGVNSIPNSKSDDSDEFLIEDNQVYAVHVTIGTSNNIRTGKYKAHLHQRNVHKRKCDLKLKASRLLYSAVDQHHPVFPFSLDSLLNEDKIVNEKALYKLGFNEPLTQGLILPLEIPYEKSSDEFVSSFGMTVMVLNGEIIRLTGPFPMSYVHSEYSMTHDQKIATLFAQ